MYIKLFPFTKDGYSKCILNYLKISKFIVYLFFMMQNNYLDMHFILFHIDKNLSLNEDICVF